MNQIPGYQFILLLVVMAILLEFIFERVFKVRSKLQKIFSLPIEFYLANSNIYPYARIGALAVIVFFCNISYYKKENMKFSKEENIKYPKKVAVVANVGMALILIIIIACFGYMVGGSLGKLIYNLRH
jgi:hypothetical protein